MTEAGWLACTEPEHLFDWLGVKLTLRKAILCACACCRALHWRFADSRAWAAVEAAEQLADGTTTPEVLKDTATEAHATWGETYRARYSFDASPHRPTNACEVTAWAACDLLAPFRESNPSADAIRSMAVNTIGRVRMGVKQTKAPQAALLREILGNPFRPVSLDPCWRTPVITTLGQAAYEDRCLPAGTLAQDCLAVLADALEEAGCTDDAILSRLRGPGPHVRGCWALDLLLGRG
ncbi:MAG: hypothetical protein L0Z62_47765 [Gemmataceae bacterium]|nr:hypothetical protein [Gemmataceae bacterium]